MFSKALIEQHCPQLPLYPVAHLIYVTIKTPAAGLSRGHSDATQEKWTPPSACERQDASIVQFVILAKGILCMYVHGQRLELVINQNRLASLLLPTPLPFSLSL